MKALAVKQVEGAEVPVEVLAESIQAISEGVKKLRAGPLNDKALVLLIQHAAPKVGQFPARDVTQKEIKAVLEGLEFLSATYIKRKPKP